MSYHHQGRVQVLILFYLSLAIEDTNAEILLLYLHLFFWVEFRLSLICPTGWPRAVYLGCLATMARLVHKLKYMFSVFKQYYTYFHAPFYQHVFLKKLKIVV